MKPGILYCQLATYN